MKKISILISILIFGMSSLSSQTADEVIALYYDAIGGKEKFESMNCFEKYKSYTNSNCVPKFCRDLQTITE